MALLGVNIEKERDEYKKREDELIYSLSAPDIKLRAKRMGEFHKYKDLLRMAIKHAEEVGDKVRKAELEEALEKATRK